ncbi:MAG: cytochrome b/b6 domain-containing protein [Gammaproteobacteria bacterium]|nr:cytochrome b/b6 domain-containing protein [Gammaproteobacteria bacterium]
MPDARPPADLPPLDAVTRLLHLGLMVFGVAAWLSGDWAGSYKRAEHLGFDVHRWAGIGLSACLALRLVYGLIGPRAIRFSQWLPYTPDRLRLAWADILDLLQGRLPQRPRHQGLSAVVQAYGLAVFAWMAITGSLLFFLLEPGRKADTPLKWLLEVHKVGEGLIPVYLAIHVAAVLVHAVLGHDVWRRMFFLKP